jgi:hypothetical protein
MDDNALVVRELRDKRGKLELRMTARMGSLRVGDSTSRPAWYATDKKGRCFEIDSATALAIMLNESALNEAGRS